MFGRARYAGNKFRGCNKPLQPSLKISSPWKAYTPLVNGGQLIHDQGQWKDEGCGRCQEASQKENDNSRRTSYPVNFTTCNSTIGHDVVHSVLTTNHLSTESRSDIANAAISIHFERDRK